MATKSQAFSSSGTFNVPSGVSLVFLTMFGGGGAGGGVPSSTNLAGGGGGAGEACYNVPYKVTPSAAITVTVGTGGTGSDAMNGTSGTDTSFDDLIVRGGAGGTSPIFPSQGIAGSGGGVGGGTNSVNPADHRGGLETTLFFGGASGGRPSVIDSAGPAGPYLGGLHGLGDGGTHEAGPGGAASIYGKGATGGAAQPTGHPGGNDGLSSGATIYSAGGGGGGNCNAPGGDQDKGGNGTKGYVIVMWLA